MNIYDLFAAREEGAAQRELAFSFDGTADEFAALPDADEAVVSLLKSIGNTEEPVRIVTGLKFSITKNVTSQIIHYKDAYKPENPALTIPYMAYGKKKDHDYAVILMPKEEAGYLYAKALYFCLTEKEGLYDTHMNDIAALYLDPDHKEEVEQSFRDIVTGSVSLGFIQRHYDRIYFGYMDHLKELCVAESARVFREAQAKLETAEERRGIIEDAIVRCYLLKKCMYVHFMKDRNLLNGRFQGDIKKMRTGAKEATTAIPFVSYSELWRYHDAMQKAPKFTVSEKMPAANGEEEGESPKEFAKRVLGIQNHEE